MDAVVVLVDDLADEPARLGRFDDGRTRGDVRGLVDVDGAAAVVGEQAGAAVLEDVAVEVLALAVLVLVVAVDRDDVRLALLDPVGHAGVEVLAGVVVQQHLRHAAHDPGGHAEAGEDVAGGYDADDEQVGWDLAGAVVQHADDPAPLRVVLAVRCDGRAGVLDVE